MAASPPSPDDTENNASSDTPTARTCVQNVYEQHPELATKAYHREYNYRTEVADKIESQHDTTVTDQEVRDQTLELARLGLLADYANIDET